MTNEQNDLFSDSFLFLFIGKLVIGISLGIRLIRSIRNLFVILFFCIQQEVF